MMEKLVIEETKNSPYFLFDPSTGYFGITGKSFPENARKVYTPVFEWLKLYNPDSSTKIHLVIQLHYISSSSLINLLELVKRFCSYRENGVDLILSWHYDEDDEDMKKVGEDFMKIVDFQFDMVED